MRDEYFLSSNNSTFIRISIIEYVGLLMKIPIFMVKHFFPNLCYNVKIKLTFILDYTVKSVAIHSWKSWRPYISLYNRRSIVPVVADE